MSERSIRAVVFDMDGVLVDSEPLWHETEREIFARYGVHLSAKDCQETTGVRIDGVVRHWRERFPDRFAGVVDEDVVDALVRGVVARVEQRGTPLEGAVAAVDDAVHQRLLGPARPGKAQAFEDQWCTGGTLVELAVDHDRWAADLRPLLGDAAGICAHPYDLAGWLVAAEAGAVVTDLGGGGWTGASRGLVIAHPGAHAALLGIAASARADGARD